MPARLVASFVIQVELLASIHSLDYKLICSMYRISRVLQLPISHGPCRSPRGNASSAGWRLARAPITSAQPITRRPVRAEETGPTPATVHSVPVDTAAPARPRMTSAVAASPSPVRTVRINFIQSRRSVRSRRAGFSSRREGAMERVDRRRDPEGVDLRMRWLGGCIRARAVRKTRRRRERRLDACI